MESKNQKRARTRGGKAAGKASKPTKKRKSKGISKKAASKEKPPQKENNKNHLLRCVEVGNRHEDGFSVWDKQRGAFILDIPMFCNQKKRTSVTFKAFTVSGGKDIWHLKPKSSLYDSKIRLPSLQIGVVVNPEQVDLTKPLTRNCISFHVDESSSLFDAPEEVLVRALSRDARTAKAAQQDELFTQKVELLDARSRVLSRITKPVSQMIGIGGQKPVSVSLTFEPEEKNGHLQLYLGSETQFSIPIPPDEKPYYFVFYLTSLADNRDVIQMLQVDECIVSSS